jgi:hypothetical protein
MPSYTERFYFYNLRFWFSKSYFGFIWSGKKLIFLFQLYIYVDRLLSVKMKHFQIIVVFVQMSPIVRLYGSCLSKIIISFYLDCSCEVDWKYRIYVWTFVFVFLSYLFVCLSVCPFVVCYDERECESKSSKSNVATIWKMKISYFNTPNCYACQ